MAKKKTPESAESSSPAPRRPRQPRRAAAGPAGAPIDTAANANRDRAPAHDDIAVAAYHRYLKRGGRGGSDFDDWVEAERELQKNSR